MIWRHNKVDKADVSTLIRAIRRILHSGDDLPQYYEAVARALNYWADHTDYSFGSDESFYWDGVVCFEVLEDTGYNTLAREIMKVGVLSDETMNIWITNHGWRLK